jgi:CTP synthase (UTP-ammonia lyase)
VRNTLYPFLDFIGYVRHVLADGSGEIPDACVIELGGTVGDIESAPFIEALRQFQFRVGQENVCFVHVSLALCLTPVGEQKTKPTQHTVKELRGLGIIPDILVCRSENPLEDETRAKLAAFCHVSKDAVVSAHDVSNLYQIPISLHEQSVLRKVSQHLGFEVPDSMPRLDDRKSAVLQGLDDREIGVRKAGVLPDHGDVNLFFKPVDLVRHRLPIIEPGHRIWHLKSKVLTDLTQYRLLVK